MILIILDLSEDITKESYNYLGKFLETPKVNQSIFSLINQKNNIISDPYFFSKNENIITINPYTMINYEKNLVQSFHNIIYDLPFPINTEEFYTCLIYLIQGIPSKYFIFDYSNLCFILINKSFRILGTTNNLIENYVSEFIKFGNSVFLIRSLTEFYLFKNENTKYLIKTFFEFLNEFLIKLNEKFINIKTRIIYKKDLHLSGLSIKLKKYSELINTLYYILDLPKIVDQYRNFKNIEKDKFINENPSRNNFFLINIFLEFYNMNSPLKSNYILDTLFGFFYYFNVKNSNYYLTKNLLLNTMKSYMKYIYHIIFNNEIIDNNEDLFLNRNQNNISFSINTNKIPNFLIDYKNTILNISILINLINKYDINYFMICNLKLTDLLQYLENFDFDNTFTNDSISEFISIKKKIF